MLNRQKDGLEIFDNFVKEYKIPKVQLGQWETLHSDGSIVRFVTGDNFITVDNNGNITQRTPFWQKVKSVFGKKERFNAPKFFNQIKKSYRATAPEDLLKQKERIQTMFVEAKNNGQTALYEKLEKEGKRIKREIDLIMNGMTIFVEEEQVVQFCKNNSTKKLKLDWLKNYARPIPPEVSLELRNAQANELFDNYVIMHYDPEQRGSMLTKKEEEARKDPILFGVMECSNRLYFLGDWEDEYCDLKLTDIIGNDERVYNQVLTVSKMVDLVAHNRVKLLVQGSKKKKK